MAFKRRPMFIPSKVNNTSNSGINDGGNMTNNKGRCLHCGSTYIKRIGNIYKCDYCKIDSEYLMPEYSCKEIDTLLLDPKKNEYAIGAKKIRYPGIDWDGITVPVPVKKGKSAETVLKEHKEEYKKHTHGGSGTLPTARPVSTSVQPTVIPSTRKYNTPTPSTSNKSGNIQNVIPVRPKAKPDARCAKCGCLLSKSSTGGYYCAFCDKDIISVMPDYMAEEIDKMLLDPIKNRLNIEAKEVRYPAIRFVAGSYRESIIVPQKPVVEVEHKNEDLWTSEELEIACSIVSFLNDHEIISSVQVKNVLADLLPGKPGIVNILSLLEMNGILIDIQKSDNIDDMLLHRYVSLLEKNHFIEKNMATKMVLIWIYSYGIKYLNKKTNVSCFS